MSNSAVARAWRAGSAVQVTWASDIAPSMTSMSRSARSWGDAAPAAVAEPSTQIAAA